MKEIGTEAFCNCKNLISVVFTEGSKLERIGERCFCKTKIEELALPSMLTEVTYRSFSKCDYLETIYLNNEKEINLGCAMVPNLAQVIVVPAALAGGMRIQDLRLMKHVVIPNSVDKIGAYWFWGSEIEKVTIMASVREIAV